MSVDLIPFNTTCILMTEQSDRSAADKSRRMRKIPFEKLAVIDFEATCLPTSRPGESRPIEVGLAYVASGQSRSWLIRPPPEWKAHWAWHAASEAVHNISVDQLERDGRDLDEVRTALQKAVSGYITVSDNPEYDKYWARSLFDGDVPFVIDDYDAVVGAILGHMSHDERLRLYLAEQLALVRHPIAHRAGSDARRIAEILRILLQIDAAPA